MICACERAKNPKNFKPRCIKAGDVKTLYANFRMNMPDLPLDSKQFCGFDITELTKACCHLQVNGYIFDCEVTDDGFKGSAVV